MHEKGKRRTASSNNFNFEPLVVATPGIGFDGNGVGGRGVNGDHISMGRRRPHGVCMAAAVGTDGATGVAVSSSSSSLFCVGKATESFPSTAFHCGVETGRWPNLNLTGDGVYFRGVATVVRSNLGADGVERSEADRLLGRDRVERLSLVGGNEKLRLFSSSLIFLLLGAKGDGLGLLVSLSTIGPGDGLF